MMRYHPISWALVILSICVGLGTLVPQKSFPALAVGTTQPVPLDAPQVSKPDPKVVAELNQRQGLKDPSTPDVSFFEPPMVGLPAGYHFMYIIPASEAAESVARARPLNIYVAYEEIPDPDAFHPRDNMRRRIHFMQPGGTPGSWVDVLWIDENPAK